MSYKSYKGPEKTALIRNSTAEFLIFTGQAGDQSIEARYEYDAMGFRVERYVRHK